MFAPLLVSCIQTIQFLLDKVIRRDKKQVNLVLMLTAWSSIFPVFTVYMLFMDQVFVLNTTILAPVAFLFKAGCGIDCLNSFIDGTYEFLFQMKSHEVSGFRRMRTITQVIFETLIQFAVQIHMLIYAAHFSPGEGQDDFGVDLTSILCSVALAVGHLLLEYVQLSYEAKAC